MIENGQGKAIRLSLDPSPIPGRHRKISATAGGRETGRNPEGPEKGSFTGEIPYFLRSGFSAASYTREKSLINPV